MKFSDFDSLCGHAGILAENNRLMYGHTVYSQLIFNLSPSRSVSFKRLIGLHVYV